MCVPLAALPIGRCRTGQHDRRAAAVNAPHRLHGPIQYANKQVSPRPERCVGYGDVKHWQFAPREEATHEDFAWTLDWLSDQPHMMIVRGQLARFNDRMSGLRRLIDSDDPDNERDGYFVSSDRSWIVFDFDGSPVPVGLADGAKVEACGHYLRSRLPSEFAAAACVVAATASTGMPSASGPAPRDVIWPG